MMCWKKQTGSLVNNQCQHTSSVKVMHGSLDELIELGTKNKNYLVMFVLKVKMVLS